MNKEALAAGHEVKKRLLRGVIEQKVWQIKPRTLSVARWSMQRKIGFQYTFTDKTYEELGNQYGGRKREDIRQLNHRFLDNIHNNLPPELQAQYPRESIPDGKPLSQRSRERQSELRGGASLKIKKAVEKQGAAKIGIGDINSIVRTAGITRGQLLMSRRVLRSWGIDIDDLQSTFADFAEKVKSETDDKELQKILDSYIDRSLYRYIRHRKDLEKVLIDLTSVLRKAGFYPHTHLAFFAEKLRANPINIPVKGVRDRPNLIYWVVYYKHEQRIIDTLKDDPDLQEFKENPVKLVCGNFDGKIPTTADFTNKKRFRKYGTNIAGIIKEVTGYYISSRGGPRAEDFLRGCPVPVFSRYTTTKHNRYIYPLDRTEELKAFLRSKQVKI